LIIAFVVAIWAAYFVPLALRRYDEASKNASVESSGFLSRVIARPSSSTSEPDAAEEPVEVLPVLTESVAVPRRGSSRAAKRAAARRRRTLTTLLGTVAIVGTLSGFTAVSPYWVAVPIALVVTWLVACRLQVRNELGLARIKAPTLRRTALEPPADEEQTVIVSGQFEDINPGLKHVMEVIALESDALDDQIVIAVPSVSTAGEALWDPLPVTLPTYVTKPRAGRTVRTIEFGQTGAWTSGHIEGEDVELPPKEDTGDQRRAVGH